MVRKPFFSICIPATDRSQTIFNTLRSVAHQTFRDFECIITIRDPEGEGSTKEEIDRFFSSSVFKNYKFNYKYNIVNKQMAGTDDWNDPVKLASGKYIAMLEGDDTYTSYHLGQAYELLSEMSDIGLYASGLDNLHETIESEEFIRHICSVGSIPPPSQSIFKRIDPSQNRYLFNTTTYDYCPEMELWYRIMNDGYNAYVEASPSVIRGKSINDDKSFWVDRVHDKFKFISDCCGSVENKHAEQGKKRVANRAANVIASGSVDDKSSMEIENALLNNVGCVTYHKYRLQHKIPVRKGLKVLYSQGPSELKKKVKDRYFS
jgi:glycosyltransferase involved in cell wall biosynthesis